MKWRYVLETWCDSNDIVSYSTLVGQNYEWNIDKVFWGNGNTYIQGFFFFLHLVYIGWKCSYTRRKHFRMCWWRRYLCPLPVCLVSRSGRRQSCEFDVPPGHRWRRYSADMSDSIPGQVNTSTGHQHVKVWLVSFYCW